MALNTHISLGRRAAFSKKRRKRESEDISINNYWKSPVPSLTRSYQKISLFKAGRDMMKFCFGASSKDQMDGDDYSNDCVFCDITRGTGSTTILYSDDKVVVFPDINPSAFRHYLVIPVKHIPTVKNLERKAEDHQLVNHMLSVGRDLLKRDAPNSEEHRFGFHQPPFNSINHLHLHCLALPFLPWRSVKYTSLGRLGGFIEAEKLLEKIKPYSFPF